jgi:acyl-CoA thioester hydrolase
MESKLGRFPVSISIPVAWGEQDAFQHVNNVVYARWIESARIAYFERIGLLERMRQERVGPIVGRIAIDFRRPVTFPDTVRVEVTTLKLGNSSFTMGYRLRSAAQDAEVALGEDVIVLLDYRTGKKVPLDARLRETIRAVEVGAPAA